MLHPYITCPLSQFLHVTVQSLESLHAWALLTTSLWEHFLSAVLVGSAACEVDHSSLLLYEEPRPRVGEWGFLIKVPPPSFLHGTRQRHLIRNSDSHPRGLDSLFYPTTNIYFLYSRWKAERPHTLSGCGKEDFSPIPTIITQYCIGSGINDENRWPWDEWSRTNSQWGGSDSLLNGAHDILAAYIVFWCT